MHPAAKTALPALAMLMTSSAQSAMPSASRRHLFVEPDFLRRSENVKLEVNPPLREEIVLRPDKPWEARMITFWVKVIDDGGKLRMWYTCRDRENRPNMAYAESPDGVHWQKPNLGIAEYGGSRENNLLNISSLDGAVFVDPRAKTPEEKYVYLASSDRPGPASGLLRYHSPDGLHWKHDKAAILPFRFDTQNVAFWDERRDAYVLYLRGWDMTPGWDWRKRTVVRLEAKSLLEPLPVKPSGAGDNPDRKRHDRPRVVDEIPAVLAADGRDAPNSDIYNLSAAPYPPDNRWYFGFPSVLRRERNLSDGKLHAELAASADGIHWHRYDRKPYLRRGPEGSENENMVFVGPGMIVRGDEIWQYGTGFKSRHGDTAARRERTDGVIYRYVQRLDGFLSLDFAGRGGSCLTAPVTVEGRRLFMNVQPGNGSIRVGLHEPGGAPIPGFSEADCAAITRDSTRAEVSWAGKGDLSALAGREVQVGFSGKEAKLYSFYFSE